MRDTAAFNRLLQLEGVNVTEVDFGDDTVTVTARLQRRKLACPACAFTTWARYNTRPVASSWRHLQLGTWRLVVRAQLRRLALTRARGAGRGCAVRPPRVEHEYVHTHTGRAVFRERGRR